MKSCSESPFDRLLLFGEGFGRRGEEVRAPPAMGQVDMRRCREQETEGGQRSSVETTQKKGNRAEP